MATALTPRRAGDERHLAFETTGHCLSPFGESNVYDQIAAGQPELIATMMGERQLMMESLVEPVALRMSLDPNSDVRPRLLVHSVHAAMTVAWLIGLNNRQLNLEEVLEAALDVFEQGMAQAMIPPVWPLPKSGDSRSA